MRSIPLTLLFTAIGAVLSGQQDVKLQSSSVDESITAIKRELEQIPQHPWAGDYSTGLGLSGTNLVVAPASGVAIRDWACLGTMAENDGTVRADGDNLIFAWRSASETLDPIETVYIPIEWGHEQFLIPRSQILEFCQHARSERPFLSQFLRRDGGETSTPQNKLVLPPEYSHYATMDDIHTRVISVEPQKHIPDVNLPRLRAVAQDVTLDAGTKDGIQPMMRLYLSEHHANSPTRLTVTTVGEHVCEATGWVWALDDEEVEPLVDNLEFSSNSRRLSNLQRIQLRVD